VKVDFDPDIVKLNKRQLKRCRSRNSGTGVFGKANLIISTVQIPGYAFTFEKTKSVKENLKVNAAAYDKEDRFFYKNG